MQPTTKAILSIQSHVAYGYVGNKAATFPLQALGLDVWPVNTVEFSNHTGYGKWRGEIFTQEHIRGIIGGLEELGVVNQCAAILSGYMGSSEICHEVLASVQRWQRLNPNIIYLCDPVIGNNQCFVKPEVLDFFKTSLTADIITPNQFEAETFCGIKINVAADLKRAAAYFHQRGTKIVIITGVKLADLAADSLYVFISYNNQYYIIKTQEYNFQIAPNGTGDLFSAVFLGSYLVNDEALDALRKTVYFMQLVMQNTFLQQSRELLVTSINYAAPNESLLPEVIKL